MLGGESVVHRQHVQAALAADLAAQVVVRLDVADDLAAAVIEDQQWLSVAVDRPVVPRPDRACRAGDREIGHRRHGDVLLEAGGQDSQLSPGGADVGAGNQGVDTDRRHSDEHQLQRRIQCVAVDRDRTTAQQQAFDGVWYPRKSAQRHAGEGVDDGTLGSPRRPDGRRLSWQTRGHGSSLDHAE